MRGWNSWSASFRSVERSLFSNLIEVMECAPTTLTAGNRLQHVPLLTETDLAFVQVGVDQIRKPFCPMWK